MAVFRCTPGRQQPLRTLKKDEFITTNAALDHWHWSGSCSTRDQQNPRWTWTPYVIWIHHVLDGNYTTPRYVDVRTRTRWNRGLSQINWLARTLKYCVYFRNSPGGSVRGGTRVIVYTAPSDSVRRGTTVIVYTAPKAEPNRIHAA